MIHGPFSHFNQACACMVEGKCSEEFPQRMFTKNINYLYSDLYYKRWLIWNS